MTILKTTWARHRGVIVMYNLDDSNGWWADALGYLAINNKYSIAQDWLDGLQAMAEPRRSHRHVAAQRTVRARDGDPLSGRDVDGPDATGGQRCPHSEPGRPVIVAALNGRADLSTPGASTMDTSG